MPEIHFLETVPRSALFGDWGSVCRLALATRGDAQLGPESYLAALDRGVNYFNWCGYRDGLSAAVRQLGSRRGEMCLAAQFQARTAKAAQRELDEQLQELGTDYIDVLTYYYVEEQSEWDQIVGPGGAAEFLDMAKRDGRVRMIGLTSHQRNLAASFAATGLLDLLMIRYNAAHRGAERQIFPVTMTRAMPVVTYTALRWGALMRATPEDPPGFVPPTAAECYQFVLGHPGATLVLMAPDSEAELSADLALLDNWRGLDADRYKQLQAHGDRVRKHAGSFP